MEITFTRKSIKEINKWLEKNGFSTECELNSKYALCYSPSEDIIYVPKHYEDCADSLFMKTLRKLGLTSDFEAVTLSFLHELGHAQTLHLLTNKESKDCDTLKGVYELVIDGDCDDYYLMYWTVTDEEMANRWAAMYADLFGKKVQKLEDIIEQNVKFG